MPKARAADGYSRYLNLPKLLNLQKRLSDAHDELQFIIVHQVFELWFKLVVFELEAARDAMTHDQPAQAERYLQRIQAVVRSLMADFDIIETMRPYDFLEFRSRLQPASGFQSLQFREIEFVSGLKDERYLRLFRGAARARLQRRMREPCLWDAYVRLLDRQGLRTATHRQTLRSVIRILKAPDRHPLGRLTEALIEYDSLFANWRNRHIRMTMRMIGDKPGTGQKSVAKLVGAGYDQMGSGGVDYLRTTLPKTFFPVLWEARTFIER